MVAVTALATLAYCARSHSAEVTGIHPVDAPAHKDVAALERLAERVCAGAWERKGKPEEADHVYGRRVFWAVSGDASPRERTIICGVDDTD